MALLLAACGSSGVTTTLGDPRQDDAVGVSPVEYVERLVRCIRTGGGEVELVNAVTFSANPGPDMSDQQMQELMSDCRAKAGPPPERQTDPETARRVYAAYLDVRECLMGLGYEPDPPPSEDVFVESFGGQDGGWFPYNGLEDQFVSMGQQLEVEEQCPPWVQ